MYHFSAYLTKYHSAYPALYEKKTIDSFILFAKRDIVFNRNCRRMMKNNASYESIEEGALHLSAV